MELPAPLLDAHLALRGTPLPEGLASRLRSYHAFVRSELEPVTFEVDRRARPYLAHHDLLGGDPEEVVLNPAHRTALGKIYASGLATGAVAGRHPWSESFALGFLTTDVGCFCSATVTMATAFSLAKYGSEELRTRFLPALLAQGGAAQGATWATEAQGGSDLGANRTTARRVEGERFHLTGEKYFCSNVGAAYAVVTARPEGAPEGPRGVRLFLAPARRENGGKNWRVRRLKEKLGTTAVPTGEISLEASEAFLLGRDEEGIVPTMEMLNVSRICNAIGSAGVLARGLEYALEHAGARSAFGRRLRDHPLLAQDLALISAEATSAALLAFDPALSLDEVWQERPPRSPAARLLRFATHAAKLVTADQAIRGTYAAMEVLGGPGYLEEFPLAKLVRDAMVVPIWEGGANRQALDADELAARGHPEAAWIKAGREELDKGLGGDAEARHVLQGRLEVAERLTGGSETEAKLRLRSYAEVRQATLLGTLARLSPSEEARRGHLAELKILGRIRWDPGRGAAVDPRTVEDALAIARPGRA